MPRLALGEAAGAFFAVATPLAPAEPDSLAVLDAPGTSSLWKRNARPVSAATPCAAASRNLSTSLYLLPMSGEPSHFNARAMARWLASRGRPHAKRQPPGPRPTLGDLQRSHCWTWVYREKCLHHAPMALVPLMTPLTGQEALLGIS
jgi:hypothetical protein